MSNDVSVRCDELQPGDAFDYWTYGADGRMPVTMTVTSITKVTPECGLIGVYVHRSDTDKEQLLIRHDNTPMHIKRP